MRWAALVVLSGCAPSLLGLPSKETMATYVASRHAKGPQHFCVAKYDDYALVFWQEGRQILLWNGSNDPNALLHPHGAVDLDTDVVATERDIDSSTYRVTKAWVEEKQRDCHEFGTRYTITAQ